jgi:hypothetical protein
MMIRSAAIAAMLVTAPAPAQPRPCAAPEYRQLDFWVGDWEARFDDGSGGSTTGRNVVTRILGDCVIEENFDGNPGTKLIGRSLSIYDARAKTWRQTWVDDQGSVFVLTGGPDGKDFVLATAPFGEGAKSRLRMVFTDIAADSFTWIWQKSSDGGSSWVTNWRIDYRRKGR